MPKLKRVGFRIPLLNVSKVRTLNRDSLPRTVTGAALQRRNARLMRENPWCVMCAAKGLRRLVAEFDHIVSIADGGPDVDSNLQGLCLPCHRAKSAEESRRRNLPGLA